MSNVLIIGGGFAGVWAAAGAVRTAREAGSGDDALRVTLIDAGDDMVIRPRLYETDPHRMRVPLDRVLGPIGVRRLAATVTEINTQGRTVRAVTRDGSATELSYDSLVLAAGSRVVRPTISGAEHLFDVDTMPGAAALHGHLARLADGGGVDRGEGADEAGRFTAVVVGAGFTGLEVATELVDRLQVVAGGRAMRVVLVERAEQVGPELGAESRALRSSRRSPRPAWSFGSAPMSRRSARTV